jgi:hypothetical protein
MILKTNSGKMDFIEPKLLALLLKQFFELTIKLYNMLSTSKIPMLLKECNLE